MHLLKAISSGVSGARNGTVEVYERGTAVLARVFADHAGRIELLEGELALDSAGSGQLYVDELVDVVVRGEDGSIVREWTEGVSASSTLVPSSAFTVETLAEALDLYMESAGANDWNVLLDEEEQSIYSAIYGTAGVFVTAASYGAIGDGTGDDWSAIQGAINAARIAGGGTVFLAAGNFPVSSAIELPTGVSLVGNGSGSTTITLAAGPETLIIISGTSGKQVLRGVTLASSIATDLPLVMDLGVDSLVVDCVFDGANCSAELYQIESTGFCAIDSSHFNIVSEASFAINTSLNNAGRLYVSQSRFVAPETYNPENGVVGFGDIHLDACVFDCGATTSGTSTMFFMSGDIFGTIDYCELYVNGGDHTICAIGNLNNSGGAEFFFEDGTQFLGLDSVTMYTMSESSSGYFAKLGSVESRHSPITENTTAINSGNVMYLAADARQYGVYSVHNDDATAGALTSGICFGASGSTTYSANVEQGRRTTLLIGMKTAEDFLLSAPNENRTRNSACRGWKSLAGSVYAMNLLMYRSLAQSPSGETTRWHCIGQSSGEPTVDTTQLEGYTA